MGIEQSMLERVARSIVLARGHNPDWCLQGSGSSSGEMTCAIRAWQGVIPEARAAIAAMKHPTGVMWRHYALS